MSGQSSDESSLQGYREIAAYLSQRFEVHVSEDAAYRLGSRKTDPLPVHGYRGRVWAFPSELDEWIARQPRNPRRAR